MFAEIVPEIKVSNKTDVMIDCQLATGSESPQLGQNNHYQLFVINSKYSFSKNQNIHYQFLIVNFQRFIFYD